MAKIALNQYEVRKDKDATISKTVSSYEAKVLQFMFGKDNVELVDSNVHAVELDPAGEEERLMNSYGGAVVQEVFGKEPGRIQELAEAAAAKTEAEPKAESAPKAAAKGKGKAAAEPADEAPAA